MPTDGLPIHLRKSVRALLAAGGAVARDGAKVLIDGPMAPAAAARAYAEELAQYVVPSVDAAEAELVRSSWPTPAPLSLTSPRQRTPARR